MTEKEKMLAGKIYDTSDSEIGKLRLQAHKLSAKYNLTTEDETGKREKILQKLLPDGNGACLQGPIYFDYGVFTKFGKNCFANFNFIVLDCAPVTIGDDVFFGPNCTLATPVHPLCTSDRKMRVKPDGTVYDLEYAKPITIGKGCWLASNVVVTGGVTIGENCIIGAGSVVTRDIPPDSFAAGVPCKVIRKITEEDKLSNHPELF